ncbi:hypothetical protein C0995_008728 [Termitomyces sp. Mi166|nr:hypothetical protein C0995_008728 [Termitomyces sp. Mi166\
MLVPLHKTVFSLLEGLLDDWRLLNLNSVKWPCKSEVCQACVNLWSLNKQAPWAAEFGKTVVSWEHTISTIEQIKLMHFEKMVIELESTVPTVAPKPVVNLVPTPVSATSSIQCAPSVPYIADPSSPPMHLLSELSLQEQEEVHATSGTLSLTQEPSSRWSAPHNKGKGKAKVIEDDNNEEATQKLRKELEDFMIPTTFDDKLLASLLPPLSEYYEGDIGLLQSAKVSGGRKGDITLVLPAMRALVLLKNGTIAIVVLLTTWLITAGTQLVNVLAGAVIASPKAACGMASSRELVDSDSNKEDEEDRVHVIEHIEELTGAKKRKEIIELDKEIEIVAPKTPAAGPLCLTSKPIVLVPSVPKFVPKLIIALASSSTPKPAAATALSKPTPAKSAGPAVKGGSIVKDPFMVRHFKLAGTEESRALIVNQVTEVPVTQETLREEESSNEDNEDGQGNNDNSDDDNVTMEIDSAKHPEETQPVVLLKTTVTEVVTPVPVPVPLKKPKRTPFFKLYCTNEHIPFLPLGLQVPIQFEQN